MAGVARWPPPQPSGRPRTRRRSSQSSAAGSPRRRSCTCTLRIIGEPEKQVVYPSSIIMEGGRYGTRPVFPRTCATRTTLPLQAPVLGVATGMTHDGPDDARIRWYAHGRQPRHERRRAVGLLSRGAEPRCPGSFSDGHERRTQPNAHGAGARVANGRAPRQALEDDRRMR
jgi:hypothetical protein